MLNNDKYFNQSIITSENIQNRLSQFVEGLDINTIVELINKDIHPKIENHYNYFQIKTPKHLVELMNSEHFQFNTRITKFILMMNEEDFDFVMENISNGKKNEMLRLAISNNYHQVDEYIKNMNKLKNNIQWQLTYKKDKEKTSTHQNSQLV